MEFILLIVTGFFYCYSSQGQGTDSIKKKFSNLEFQFNKVTGIVYKGGVTRHDQSDVIKEVQHYKTPDANPKFRGAGYLEQAFGALLLVRFGLIC